jgi:hypothetical protein
MCVCVGGGAPGTVTVILKGNCNQSLISWTTRGGGAHYKCICVTFMFIPFILNSKWFIIYQHTHK